MTTSLTKALDDYALPDAVNSYGEASIDELMDGYEEMVGSAKTAYDLAEEYFDGTRPEFFADLRYRQALLRTGTTFRLNYAKTPVEALVDRLEINGISSGDPMSLAILEAFWEENQMDLEALEIHRRACEFGDALALVWPTEDIDETFSGDNLESALDDSSDDSAIGIEAYYNDPRTMRLFYDPENPRRKHYAMKLWSIKKNSIIHQRANLYFKDRIEKYITKDNADPSQSASWIKYSDEGDISWPLENPYGQVPVFHFRTERPYGTPVHKDAYGPQDIITKLVITHMNTIDYHGFPQRYALTGNDLGEGDDDTEDFEFDDDKSGDVNIEGVTEPRSGLKSEPGHVWFLKNIKAVGQFQAADSAVFLLPLVAYIRAMAQVCRTPVHKFDFQGNPPSGEALRVTEQPFVKKVRAIQMSFGATWNDLLEFILKIFKIDGRKYKIPKLLNDSNAATGASAQPDPTAVDTEQMGPPGKVTITWASPAAKDDQLAWDLALLKRDAGVPIRQVLLEAGYNKKQLDAWGVPAAVWIEPPPPASPAALPPVRVNPTQTVGSIP